jgi:hypothetical protein
MPSRIPSDSNNFGRISTVSCRNPFSRIPTASGAIETAYNPIESCQVVSDSDEIRVGIQLKGLFDLGFERPRSSEPPDNDNEGQPLTPSIGIDNSSILRRRQPAEQCESTSNPRNQFRLSESIVCCVEGVPFFH